VHVIDAGFKTIPWVFFAYYGWVSSSAFADALSDLKSL
jgi:hypothetical protein